MWNDSHSPIGFRIGRNGVSRRALHKGLIGSDQSEKRSNLHARASTHLSQRFSLQPRHLACQELVHYPNQLRGIQVFGLQKPSICERKRVCLGYVHSWCVCGWLGGRRPGGSTRGKNVFEQTRRGTGKQINQVGKWQGED